MWNTRFGNFAPRIGIAWDPTGKGVWALRAGYSTAYDEPFSNLFTNASRFNPPDSTTVFNEPSIGVGTDVHYQFPFEPSPDFAAPTLPNGGIQGIEINPSGVAQHLKTAYAEQRFFGIQHSFWHDYAFAINYVGTRGVDQYTREDYNRFAGDICNATTCSYENNRLNFGWGAITYVSNEGYSNYNGLNAQLRHNYSHGLLLVANYTYGKVLDNVTDVGLGDYSNVNGYGALYAGNADVNRGRLDYGPSEFDVRHRFTLSAVWDIPAPGKSHEMAGKIFGGWQLNSIVTLQSGRPFDVYCGLGWFDGCDFNMDGLDYDRPNRLANLKTTGFTNQQFTNGIFGDPALTFYDAFSRTSTASQTFCPNGLNSILDFGPGFQCVPVGTDGNLSRNAFRGPAFYTTDMGLFKNVKINERFKVQLRMDAFNLFNRVNLYNPIGDLGSGQFGQSTAAFPSRQFQYSLKLLF